MQLTSIVSAAGLAALSNAFLLPPDIAESDNDIITTLPVPVQVDTIIPHVTESQNLKLKCPGCPVPIPHHGKVKVMNDIPSHLELDFGIAHSDNADRLMLNDFELYPNADPFRNTLSAPVLPDVLHRQMKKRPHSKGPKSQALGFGMQTRPVAKNEEDALELIEIELDIIEVGDVFVDGIPKVQINVVKTPAGKLILGEIKTLDSEATQGNPMDKQKECATLLCKWKAAVMQKLAGLRSHKGCGGRPALVKGHEETKVEDPQEPHRGHRQKNWGLLFKNIASHILLPVAVGILAGITACILGMIAGTLAVFLWRAVVRRGATRRHHHRRHAHHRKASHSEAIVNEEKSGLMENQEEVDAPPAYGEESVVVIDDKKTENVV
ncbi:uncharacterized protein F4812DRAFT_82950 [Daldinia caldariorum]|uniref:uncharacterized protein n=1 Tax=Daldinia caldariorum TaxID=326644 RepID=UPI00200734C4|nr:uncharacterized protein F4812DRAFT_82950 [Daldinia caldariorum]KAI1466545.1 hypothetical protein F4812DRAFT_82950 [Daldinia caldariorum]